MSQAAADLFVRGTECYYQHDFTEAEKWFRSCVNANPKNDEYLCWLAQSMAQDLDDMQRRGTSKFSLLSEGKEVAELFRQAIAVNPQSERARIGYAIFMRVIPGLFGGDDMEAEKLLLDVTKENPNNLFGWHELGIFYLKARKDYDAALRCFQKAVAIAKSRPLNQEESLWIPRTYYAIGCIYLENKKDAQKALPYLEQCSKNNNCMVEFWLDLAEAYRQLDRDDPARAALREAARITKSFEHTKFTREIVAESRKLKIRDEIRQDFQM